MWKDMITPVDKGWIDDEWFSGQIDSWLDELMDDYKLRDKLMEKFTNWCMVDKWTNGWVERLIIIVHKFLNDEQFFKKVNRDKDIWRRRLDKEWLIDGQDVTE